MVVTINKKSYIDMKIVTYVIILLAKSITPIRSITR